jgi:hypothetical protein
VRKAASRTSTALPIVAKPLSKFTVTVECVELMPPKSDAPPADAPAPPPS